MYGAGEGGFERFALAGQVHEIHSSLFSVWFCYGIIPTILLLTWLGQKMCIRDSSGFFGENVISIPEIEGKFPDVEEYLTLIKKSDDAFKLLIDYFSQVEEPTIILMFGDHQPNISEKFYEQIMGKPIWEFSLEETQRRYEVPFFIWANYDIPEQNEVYISSNYLSGLLLETAGMSMTPYQNFVLDVREKIPAMNMIGYLGDDGQWHYYTEENQYRELLNKYWDIQYNGMFANRKCEEWFKQ